MKALVTGVAGFIGSHLAEALIERGDRVIGIDCFSNYYSRMRKEENIEKLLREKNFSLIEEDIAKADLSVLSDVDCCFHQAAQPGVRASWGEHFEVYIKDNILATQRLLEEAVKCGLARFVFASSSSVYGSAEKLPLKEESSPSPISPYGTTKLCAENLVSLYHKNYGLSAISLRYFTVYGERQRPDMAFYRFIRSALLGETITVYGDGNQTRDFTFVADIVSANILAANSSVCGVFNIGGGHRISLNRAIREIERLLKKKIKIGYKEAQKGDMRDTWADTRKAERELRWFPKTQLQSGLKAQIEWMEKIL
jgi:UDP-glucose 4-epimerase